MAFVSIRQPTRVFHGRAALPNVTVAAFGKKDGTNRQGAISISRSVLREAGLPDFPGATLDLLIGTGADTGSIGLVAGSRFKLARIGKSTTRVVLRTSLLADKIYRSAEARHEIGRKQLIVRLPADFPLPADAAGSTNVEQTKVAA